MKQESLDNYKKAKAIVASGKSIKNACNEAHIGMATYYKIEKNNAASPTKITAPTVKPKKHHFIDLEPIAPEDTVTIVLCKANQLSNILAKLKG